MPAVLWFILAIITAHFFAPPGYSALQNTISELAAQGNQYQVIMQSGFIGFGILLTTGWIRRMKSERKLLPQDVLLVIYGLAILCSGIWSTAPINSGASFSEKEAALHSVFAAGAGFALVAGMLGYLFLSQGKGQHLVFLILVTLSSASFGLAENGALPIPRGIIQRTLYTVSFVWLLIGPCGSTGTLKGVMQTVRKGS